jgi:type IV secretion system protein VirB9
MISLGKTLSWMFWFVSYASVLATSPLAAQQDDAPAPTDPRIQTISYNPVAITQVTLSDGYHAMIAFAPGERIETIALGDSNGWQASASKRGDLLFVKSGDDAQPTNMTVVTDVRVYMFDLELGSNGQPSPYMLRFRFADEAAPADGMSNSQNIAELTISGDSKIRPKRVFQAGGRTFILWSEDSPMGATYAFIDGREVLTNGEMVGPHYVIADAPRQLVFRLDKLRAVATLTMQKVSAK